MKKLLIIEDDPILLKMYVDKFNKDNYEVTVAVDGTEGIDQSVKSLPDFIVLDLRLPKTDGIEVLRTLKNSPVTKNIPVAILSVVQEDIAFKDDPDLAKEVVAYWRKDLITPAAVYQGVNQFLQSHG